jgi:hypothetical protein
MPEDERKAMYEIIPADKDEVLGRYFVITSKKPTADSLKMGKGHPVDLAVYLGLFGTSDFNYKTDFSLGGLGSMVTVADIKEITEPEEQIKVLRAAKESLELNRNRQAERLEKAEEEIDRFNDYVLFDFIMKGKKIV